MRFAQLGQPEQRTSNVAVQHCRGSKTGEVLDLVGKPREQLTSHVADQGFLVSVVALKAIA
jgi:hypothetical protein